VDREYQKRSCLPSSTATKAAVAVTAGALWAGLALVAMHVYAWIMGDEIVWLLMERNRNEKLPLGVLVGGIDGSVVVTSAYATHRYIQVFRVQQNWWRTAMLALAACSFFALTGAVGGAGGRLCSGESGGIGEIVRLCAAPIGVAVMLPTCILALPWLLALSTGERSRCRGGWYLISGIMCFIGALAIYLSDRVRESMDGWHQLPIVMLLVISAHMVVMAMIAYWGWRVGRETET